MATQKRFIAKNGLDNNSNTITNIADPVNSQDVATKNYTTSNFLGASSSAYPTVSPSLNLDFANSKQLDSRITFIRNSIATYYDGQTTALAEQNLVLQSQFVASWVPLNSTLTANSVVAPDGTTTAATLIPNTTSNTHTVYQTYSSAISGATYVFSVYLKASGYNYAILQTQFGGINGYYSFNISTGTLGTINGGATPTITSVGNGWYRCSIVLPVTISTTSSPVTFWSMSTDSVAAFVGDGTSGMQIWGAQLEQRSTATAYTPTTTAAITNYIPVLMTAPAGVPRLDYNPITGVALGLLIEEQRTNLLTYSNNFPAGYVSTPANLTVSPNSVIAPDGSQTATLFALSGTNSFNFSSTYIVPNGAVCGESIHIKDFSGLTKSTTYTFGRTDTSGTQTNVIIAVTSSGAMSISSTTNTGVSAYSSSLTAIGNGWYRLFCSYIPDNNGSDFGVVGSESIAFWGRQYEQQGQIIRTNTLGTGSTTTSIVLDVGATSGISTGNLICIVGYKAALITAYNSATQTATVAGLVVAGTTTPSLAAGAAYTVSVNTTGFATSYIPTVASTVTRAADQASITGTNFSSWYNQSQGTIYCEAQHPQPTASTFLPIFEISDGTTANRLGIYTNALSGEQFYLIVPTSTVTLTGGASITTGAFYKQIGSYSIGLMQTSLNGATVVTGSPTALPIVTKLSIGFLVPAVYFTGHIRKLSYYPVALSASNLVALTS